MPPRQQGSAACVGGSLRLQRSRPWESNEYTRCVADVGAGCSLDAARPRGLKPGLIGFSAESARYDEGDGGVGRATPHDEAEVERADEEAARRTDGPGAAVPREIAHL